MANLSSDSQIPRGEAVQAALRRLLRPLVRLCVHSGITLPTLTELLRELFVNVVEHDFPLPAKQQTDSRVSLLTGIHRKEVRRLRGRAPPTVEMPKALSRTARILAQWLAAFIDETGRPLLLPLTAPEGQPSFEALVVSVTRDIRPRAVLDDWLDRNLVSQDENGGLRLQVDALVPKAGDERQLYFFGRNLHDHMAAAVDNVTATSAAAPFMERAVHYDGLSSEAARRLEQRAREIATAALQTANRDAHLIAEADAGGTHRWNFGLYVFTADAPPMTSDDTEKSAAP